MPKMVLILVFGAIMFAISAAGSWFVSTKVLKADAQAEAPAHGEAAVDEHGHPKAEAEAPADSSENRIKDETVLTRGPVDKPLAVPVRPREWSPEELVRFGLQLQEREKDLKLQNDRLKELEIRQQTALVDVEAERKEIEGLRVQLDDQLVAAASLVKKIDEAAKILEQKKLETDAAVKKGQEILGNTDTDVLKRNKMAAALVEGMEPEQAATAIRNYANNGKKGDAVQILLNMDPARAAIVLGLIGQDEDRGMLMNELLEAVQQAQILGKK